MQNMKEIIGKGWQKTWHLNKSQFIAMELNVINSLFKITLNTKDHNEVKIKFDPTKKNHGTMIINKWKYIMEQ
jgi:hypothetical protein